MANGDLFTNATIGPIGNTGSLFLDATNDRLYVGDDVNNVKVFSGASTASGSPAPRLVTGMSTPIHGVAVDVGNDILYVSNENAGTHQISVFDSAHSVTTATPNRTITPTVSAVNQSVGGISLDAVHNLLYVAGGSASTQVMVFAGASTANDVSGATAPSKTFIGFATGILSVAVDSVNDRLYAVGANGHIYLVENVSTLSSGAAIAKDASVSGGSLTAVAVNPN
jgi:DNA-binding beta-propeller fold protein YncE